MALAGKVVLVAGLGSSGSSNEPQIDIAFAFKGEDPRRQGQFDHDIQVPPDKEVGRLRIDGPATVSGGSDEFKELGVLSRWDVASRDNRNSHLFLSFN